MSFPLRAVARLLVLFLVTLPPLLATEPPLLPKPAHLTLGTGSLSVTALQVNVQGPPSSRVTWAVGRLRDLWGQAEAVQANGTPLHLEYTTTVGPQPRLGDNEVYHLTVSNQGLHVRAETDLGILRGLATLVQLGQTAGPISLPFLTVDDHPRFAWRGVLIDVARHFQPLDGLRRALDTMWLAKLNVLHLHLTEDQGFRIESKTHPELQEKGSDGRFYTQAEITRLIADAAERGIRVVPEFDLPGHATAWLVSHPELASLPGPYEIERRWGIFDPVMDPTREGTYALLSDVFGEMAALFPDPFFHIGGDENNGVQWSANPRIQAFIETHGLKNNAGLQAHFNRRIATLLAQHGKRMMGWDEILHPDLPRDILIQSWRGPTGVAQAARAGCEVILSHGFYIDLSHPTDVHYLNDPLPPGHGLSDAEVGRVLGGEATLWSEWVDEQTFDSRLWPRTAAIAERLWSAAEVRDVPDLYRRLEPFAGWLTAAGSRHETLFRERARALLPAPAEPDALAATLNLLQLLEPLREYRRGQDQPEFTQLTPLQSLADYTRPDGALARQAEQDLRALLYGETPLLPERVLATRAFWREREIEAARLATTVAPVGHRGARELRVAAAQVASMARLVEEGLTWLSEERAAPTGWIDDAAGHVHAFGRINGSGTTWRFQPELHALVAACQIGPGFSRLPATTRRAQLQRLTAPPSAAH